MPSHLPGRAPLKVDAVQYRRVTVTAAVLGARHLVEAGVLLRHPRPGVGRAVVVVDLLHAGTMLALAAASRTYRRPALISAAAATVLAGLAATTVQPVSSRSVATSKERDSR